MSSPGRTIMRWRLPSALQVSQPTGSIQHSERPAVLAAASRRRQAACHVGINRPSAAIAASASAIVGTTSRLLTARSRLPSVLEKPCRHHKRHLKAWMRSSQSIARDDVRLKQATATIDDRKIMSGISMPVPRAEQPSPLYHARTPEHQQPARAR